MAKSKLKILREISMATSLQQIMDLGYELLGNPMFIDDESQHPLAYSKNVTVDDYEWNNKIIQGHTTKKHIYQSKKICEDSKKAYKSNEVFFVDDDNIAFPRLVKRIFVDNINIATIIAIGYFKSFKSDDLEYIEIISSFILILIQNKKSPHDTGSWGINDFLIRLLNNEKLTSTTLSEQINFHRKYPKKYFHVLTIFSVEDSFNDSSDISEAVIEISRDKNKIAFIYRCHIVTFINTDKPIFNWEIDEEGLFNVLNRWNMYACVSQSFIDLSTLYDHYLQVQQILNSAVILKHKKRFITYDNRSIYLLFESIPSGTDLKKFCDERILSLEEYDKVHNTELIPTLHVYLETVRSLTKTSKRLYVHKNTINYRINKCMELIGTDLQDGDEIFSYIFSLRIIEYCNKRKYE